MFIFWRSPVDSCDDFVSHAIRHLDDFEQLLDPPVRFGGAEPVELREHPEVLADGEQPVARRFAAGHHVDARPDVIAAPAARRIRQLAPSPTTAPAAS